MEPINRVITQIIKEKESRIDKYGHDYLILRGETGEIILVFPNQVPVSKWEELETGKKYELIITESQRGHQLLVDFTQEELIRW